MAGLKFMNESNSTKVVFFNICEIEGDKLKEEKTDKVKKEQWYDHNSLMVEIRDLTNLKCIMTIKKIPTSNPLS